MTPELAAAWGRAACWCALGVVLLACAVAAAGGALAAAAGAWAGACRARRDQVEDWLRRRGERRRGVPALGEPVHTCSKATCTVPGCMGRGPRVVGWGLETREEAGLSRARRWLEGKKRRGPLD